LLFAPLLMPVPAEPLRPASVMGEFAGFCWLSPPAAAK
jgi:hypothetical protein